MMIPFLACEGIISGIIYRPDLRTKIISETRKAVFIIYAPPGITQKEITGNFKW